MSQSLNSVRREEVMVAWLQSRLSDTRDLLCIDIKSVCAFGKLLHILIKCPFCVKECNDFHLYGIFFFNFIFVLAYLLVVKYTYSHMHARLCMRVLVDTNTKATLYPRTDYRHSLDRWHLYFRVSMDVVMKRKRHVNSEKSDPCLWTSSHALV